MKRTWAQANADEYGQIGIIESVRLRNFMCHDNLSFDFDPHMNFIVGRNGSGKSAVLTGIILALGGKSLTTGRYSSIKGFVKSGKNSASVSVTLKNCGPDAYKPDEYGEKITIERHFSLDGASSYKLKSEGGRIISNSKEDLINILTVMDIQIENPVTVLTQETSRNFLVSKNSKGDKLFKLFYEGTGLSRVEEDYRQSSQSCKDAQTVLDQKKAVLPSMEKDMKQLRSLLDKTAKINDLRKELLWANVIQFERQRDAKAAALKEIEREASNLTCKLSQCAAEIADVGQNLAGAGANYRATKEKQEATRKDLSELMAKKHALESEMREAQGTYARIERELKKTEKDISVTEKIMHDCKMKNQQDIDKDKLEHERQLKILRDEITSTDASIGTLETQEKAIREIILDLQKKSNNCVAEIQEIKYEKSRIDRDKQQLIDGKKNRLHVFGQEVINVKQEIANGVKAGIFHKEPKGPIGLYINVKKSEWNFAVQECLRIAFLKTFLCDNQADADQLSKIFARYFQRQRPSIITSKFVSEVYDVTAYKCVSQYPTLLDMLNIEEPTIINCLIDQKNIENILLIENPVDARKLMLYNPPERCTFAYSINGDQFCHSPFRKYSCRNRNQFCLLKSINAEDIRKKDEEINMLVANLSKKLAEKEDFSKQKEVKEKELVDINIEVIDMKIKRQQLNLNVKNEENSYSEPKDINILNTDLDELMLTKAQFEEKLSSCKNTLKFIGDELEISNRNVIENRRILEQEIQSCHSLGEEMNEYQSRKEKLDVTIKKIKSELGKIKPAHKETEAEVGNMISVVKIAIDQASEACSTRIDTERTPETIRVLLKDTESLVPKKNQNRDSICNEYEERAEQLKKAKQEFSKQENRIKIMTKMMKGRFEELQKVKKNTRVSLVCAFITLLKENNFNGYLRVNFESKTLEIFAKPEKSKSDFGKKPNLSQLSGGERSYVTIAFLLSLWDRIRTPFRILDEYDVFMDSNNRHLSIHLLINTAKLNKKIQYIFLSPLELPHIENSDHVKVHQMPDPRK